jgi:flagellar hook protein FlgE
MVRSLNSGVSGIQQFQEKMDIIGNNIANVNTTGFKGARVDFADSFSDTLRGSTAATAGTSGTAAMQIGTGVMTSSIKNLFGQGALVPTGYEADMGIAGEGFFVVRDPVSDVQYVTRAGNFRRDGNGYLVTDQGFRVQGLNYDQSTDPPGSVAGDILIDATGRPPTSLATATMTNWSVSREGEIKVKLSDGSEYSRGQFLLQTFTDPQMLMKEGTNLYSGIAAAGPLATAAKPGTNGLGRVESGALELSNVDLANEFSNMITAQRAFQANARIITTSDEMLQELVNLKR